jgi:hypothetical protein
MTVTGKLCRNPFSTINLPHEHGGSKAVRPSVRAPILCKHAIFADENCGFVAARSGAVYSEALGKERDSGG